MVWAEVFITPEYQVDPTQSVLGIENILSVSKIYGGQKTPVGGAFLRKRGQVQVAPDREQKTQ